MILFTGIAAATLYTQAVESDAIAAAVLTVVGVFFGTVAGLAGIVPFTMARTDQVLPDQGLGIWVAIVAVGTAATLITSLITARRALCTPAVTAAALAA